MYLVRDSEAALGSKLTAELHRVEQLYNYTVAQ